MASCIRRKPQTTYKSPTAEDHVFISTPSSRPMSRPLSATPSSSRTVHSPESRETSRRKHAIYPTLPLFHPLGHLAMSLPPLDPTEYGLPVPSVPDDRDPRPSARSKRPVAKVREAEEEINGGSPTVSSIAAVAAREVKERVSPRKRRTGGAKRKRKDGDDGDATYPAKRTRMPRGAAGQAAEDDSPVDSTQTNEGVAPVPAPEVLSDPTDTSKRRSTRAKGSLKRRDSSASETTSISANAISGETPKPDTMTASNTENSRVDEEKEEGELSDGQIS